MCLFRRLARPRATAQFGHARGRSRTQQRSGSRARQRPHHETRTDSVHADSTAPAASGIITTIHRIAIITTIHRIAIITTIHRIAIITTIHRIAIITTIHRIAIITTAEARARGPAEGEHHLAIINNDKSSVWIYIYIYTICVHTYIYIYI